MDRDAAHAKVVRDNANPNGDSSLKLREHCQRRRTALIATREPEMVDWQQVSDYVDPSRGKFSTTTMTNGQRRKRSRSKIINGKATQCVRVAAAGMQSHMTSKTRPWFQLTTPDPKMLERFDVKVWLEQVTTIIRDTLAKSNFYKAIPVVYTEDLMFAVAVMLIMPHDEEVVNFHPLTAGSYAIGLGQDGKVDSLWRCYQKTARHLKEKYGLENLPQKIKDACANNPDTYFEVQSLIEKNPDELPGIGPKRVQAASKRPWREVVWINSDAQTEKHGVLDVGGHYEAPFIAIRFNPAGDDTYSTCPGIDSLGDIKQLQYLESKKLLLIDLMAEPPLALPDTMVHMGASLAPRSKTYLPQSQIGAKPDVLYKADAQALREVKEEIRTVEKRIEDAFFYNLFLMMESIGDQTGRTATEIAERREEKATVLGPTLESVTDEGLDPTIVSTYFKLDRAGKLPPPPEALNGLPIKIEYTSVLAQAMKSSGTAGIERVAAFVGNMAKLSGNPAVLDKFDFDQAVDEYAERVGSPATIVRSDDDVDAIRQQRAGQERQAKLLAAAKPMADAAGAVKTLGEAVPQDGSVGEGLAEQLQGLAA